jgi:uncharacterized protein YdaU (DUF1376 family)
MVDRVDAWMPLHIGRYMAATGHLSNEEHGMYLLLLMHAWSNDGVIPGESERIRRICRADPKDWARSSAVILEFLTQQPDGTYRQKRLDVELAKASEVKSTKSEAGKKGAEIRWQKEGRANGKPIAEPMAEGMANEWPIPIPEPKPLPPNHHPTVEKAPPNAQTMAAVVVGSEDKAHDLAGVCIANRVTGATFNGPWVQQWVREGVTPEHLREAIAEARATGKPDPETIPVKYLSPILERVRTGKNKPVDNGWRRDEKRAVSKGRELGIEPKAGEDLYAFVARIDKAIAERARSQVQ